MPRESFWAAGRVWEEMTTSHPPSGAEKARLLRHSQAVARLRHPNLVRMLPLPGGAGLSPILGGAHKLSDFTLPAGTFKRFDLEQVIRLMLDVLSGLAALHEVVSEGYQFVHGEVCPENIYVDEHGTARLVPLMNGHSGGFKPESRGYAAPERLLGATADVRADTFSVGVMLWEALAGTRLFPDTSPAAVLARRVPQIELGPRTRWARPLCAIAERAIAFEPARRFQTALELSHAIASAAAPQLSRVNTDAWQEEAPTPVFQPRLHLAKLRASNPPPASIDILASPGAKGSAALGTLAGPDTTRPTTDAAQSLDEPPRRGGSAVLVAASLVALVAASAIVLVGWQRSPREWRELSPFLSAPTHPPAAAARIEPMSPPPAVAQRSPAVESLVPVTPAASVSAGAPTTTGAASVTKPNPSSPPSGRPLGPPTRLRGSGKVKPAVSDYGI